MSITRDIHQAMVELDRREAIGFTTASIPSVALDEMLEDGLAHLKTKNDLVVYRLSPKGQQVLAKERQIKKAERKLIS